MPADVIECDYEVLEQVATAFQQRAENTQTMLQAIRRQMDSLANDGWVGRGADAFFAEMEDDVLPRVNRLAQSLEEAEATTRRIIQVMQDAEERAGGQIPEDGGGAVIGGGGGAAGGDESNWETSGPTVQETDTGGEAFVGRASYEDNWGGVDVNAEFTGPGADYGFDYNAPTADFSSGTFGAGMEGSAGAYLGQGSASAEVAGVGARGEGMVGAEVSAGAGATFDPVNGNVGAEAKVEGFAGAKAEGSLGYSGDLGSVGVTGDARAGIGGEAGAEVGFEDGTFSADAGLGGAFGYGAGIGFEFEVNVVEAADQATEAATESVDYITEQFNSAFSF